MTERDKRIEEMCEMVHIYTEGMTEIDDRLRDAVKKGAYREIVRIYDAGYRKEEEVQKETLKNLFNSVSSFVNFSVQFLGLDLSVIRLNDLKDIIKNEFGVEVEE